MTWQDHVNIYAGLKRHDRVCQVDLRVTSSSDCIMWLKQMNKPFPRLQGLSLLSTSTEMNAVAAVLPGTFRAPDLRRLTLHGIGLPTGLPFLSSAITLSILSLTHIGASSYFSPERLVTQLENLPYLEELSIGFAIPIPLPSSERELLPAPILSVSLPTLRQLMFRGVSVYLDNLIAQINAPLLTQLNLTLLFELAFTLGNLTKFIQRTEGLGCLAARVKFDKDSAYIDAGQKESGYNKPWDIRRIRLHVNCKPLDWQIDSAAQVCTALQKALSDVEELQVDLDVHGIPSNWENTLDSMLWHELLLPFIAVKELYISSSITRELSQVLSLVAAGLVLELLPELQKLEIPDGMDTKYAFSVFVKTRKSVGRPIQLVSRESTSSRDSSDALSSLQRVIADLKSSSWQNANVPSGPSPTPGHPLPRPLSNLTLSDYSAEVSWIAGDGS